MSTPWWGFDVDKTIAIDEGNTRGGVIGEPIKPLIRRLKHYIRTGRKCSIVTARIHPREPDAHEQAILVRDFLNRVLGHDLAIHVNIRCDKDRHMIALFDDRAEQVIPNKGILVREELRRAVEALNKIAYGNNRNGDYFVAQQALESLDPWSRDLARTD